MSKTIAIDARKLGDFGIGTYILNLILGIAELDQENRYLLFTSPQRQTPLPELPHNFQQVPEAAEIYSVRELIALSWQLTRRRVDLFHATHYVLPAIVPCRSVVTIHDIIHLLFPDFLPNRFAEIYARLMIRRSLVRSDRVIAVSKNTRTDLLDAFGVGSSKIEVIHNGVESQYFGEPNRDQVKTRLQDLGLDLGYVLFVGNPKPHKNLDRVIQAYGAAREQMERPVPLVCVGARADGDLKIRQRAEHLGIAEHVQLMGHVDADLLLALYRGAGLFVYPTLYEGFGLPVVEAMASGVPVITSNNSALREVAEGYAHLVSPLDTDEIARAIAHCLNDAEHRESLIKLGKRRARDFQWSRAAQRTLEVYNEVLAGGSS